MRKAAIIILSLMTISMTIGCSSSSKRLVGAWEMVHPEPGGRESSPDDSPRNARTVKILTDTHFAFGVSHPDGRVFAGGGRYRLEGDTYTEIIGYHWNPLLVGQTVDFKCRLDGDTWYHTARFEIKGTRFNIDEIWRRVETKEKK